MDLTNILHQGNGKKAKLTNFRLLKEALFKEYPESDVYYLADASTRHKIDDRTGYDRLCDSGCIIQTPAGEQADHYIITYASRIKNSIVISCDRFKDYSISDKLSLRIVPVVIIGDQVIFSKKITEFLIQIHASPLIQ